LRNFSNSFKNDQNNVVDKTHATRFSVSSIIRNCYESDFFDGANELTQISIANGAQIKIPKNFYFGLTNLQYFQMKSDSPTGSIIQLPQSTFKGLVRLKTIKLLDNKLDFSKIHPRLFAGLKSLTEVVLTGNINLQNFDINEMKKYCGCNATVTL
jgi:hypothetical protein